MNVDNSNSDVAQMPPQPAGRPNVRPDTGLVVKQNIRPDEKVNIINIVNNNQITTNGNNGNRGNNGNNRGHGKNGGYRGSGGYGPNRHNQFRNNNYRY